MNLDAPSRARRAALAIACTALSAAIGCGRDPDRVDLYPVTGTVTVGGAPADGAKVILYPVDEALRGVGMPIPTGVAGSDGRFTLTSYEPDDGAPAGEYRVGIVWSEIVTPSKDPAQQVTRDRLQERYAYPEKSGLTASVVAGTNDLKPFALK